MSDKYDTIGIGYNTTRKADKYISERIAHHLNPGKTGLYLDIGCGTGNYTDALQKKGYPFIGIDPSKEMLFRAKNTNREIDWRKGTGENTTLNNESVNGIIAVLTIHHWTDISKGFSEMYRVLKPDGRIVIFTSTPEQMNGYWLNHYFPQMLGESIVQMPSFQLVNEAMLKSCFKNITTEKYFVREDLEDHFLYCGKTRPWLYIKPEIRKGISSFADIGKQQEISLGLSQLEKDIEDGNIRNIMDKYENDKGDYLFITGTK